MSDPPVVNRVIPGFVVQTYDVGINFWVSQYFIQEGEEHWQDAAGQQLVPRDELVCYPEAKQHIPPTVMLQPCWDRKELRDAVYQAIDVERTYQEQLGPNRTDGSQKSVGDHLVLLDYYVRRAMDDWTQTPGNEAALDEVRKVAAIAVRCMEEHGIVSRLRQPSETP